MIREADRPDSLKGTPISRELVHVSLEPEQSTGGWSSPGSVELGCWIPHAGDAEHSIGRRGYPPEFRGKVLDLVEAGRRIAEVAQALGISAQSIYTWHRQDRIDRGLLPGLRP